MAPHIDVNVSKRSRIKGMSRALAREVSDLVMDTADDIRDKARDAMKEPKSGRPYMVNKVIHIAAAPGQAPGIVTTHLYVSTRSRRTGRFSAEATASAEYANYQEFGTSKMPPHPFLRPAARRVLAEVSATAPVKVRATLARVPWA